MKKEKLFWALGIGALGQHDGFELQFEPGDDPSSREDGTADDDHWRDGT